MTNEEFYKDPKLGELRQKSRELDFGVWWRKSYEYPPYRVTWVEATGEVIAVKQANHTDLYEVLGVVKTEEEVERKLEGWAEKCGPVNSLDWVKAQL